MVDIMYRVRASSTGWVGGPGLNTFYFRHLLGDAEGNGDFAANCADRVHAAFAAASQAYPTSWTCHVDPEVDTIEASNGELTGAFVGSVPAVVTGTGSHGQNPTSLMVLLQLHTDDIVDRRRIRGRAFLGPVDRFESSNGNPDPNLLVETAKVGTQLLASGSTGNELVVWRRPRAADPTHQPHPITARAGSSHLVTSITTPIMWAILRSRRD